MKGNDDVIQVLNEVLSAELTGINQYFIHSMMCANWGYMKLADHSKKESIEEMGHAQEVIERNLYLDGRPNMDKYMKINVGSTVPQQHEFDLALEKDAVARLNRAVQLCRDKGDNGTACLVGAATAGGVAGLAIYRSDTGVLLCAGPPPFNPTLQIAGEATPTQVQIKHGGTVIGGPCPLPSGELDVTPASQSFADVVIGGCWFENDGRVNGECRPHIFTTNWVWADTKVTLGDLNGDDFTDIVLAPAELQGQRYRLAWYEAPRDAARPEWPEHIVEAPVEAVMHGLAVANMDGDGQQDMFTARMNQGAPPQEVSVYLSTGRGNSWKKVTVSERGSHDILVADFNGDGRPDILGANHGGSHQPVELWLSQPSKRADSGPLRVHPMNPRYFTDGTTDAAGSLRAVYLTGSHTWNSLQEVTGEECVRREWHLPCGPASQAALIILGHMSLKVFDLIVAVAGKQLQLDVPAIYMWQATFDGLFYGKGAAIGMILLVSVAFLIIPYLWYTLRVESQS